MLSFIAPVLSFFPCFQAASLTIGILESDSAVIELCKRALSESCVGHDVVLLNSTSCEAGYRSAGTAWAAETRYRDGIEAIITDDCTVETREIALLSRNWNLPVLMRFGTGLSVYDPVRMPTSIMFDDTPLPAAALLIESIAHQIQQYSFLLIGPYNSNPKNPTLSRGIEDYLSKKKSNVRVADVYLLDEDALDAVTDITSRTRTKNKLIVVDASFRDLTRILQKLDIVELIGDNYVPMIFCSSPIAVCHMSIEQVFGREPLFLIAPYYEHFDALNQTISSFIEPTPYDFSKYLNTYKACVTFCPAYTDAQSLNAESFRSQFAGLTVDTHSPIGFITFDDAAVAQGRFFVYNINITDGSLIPVYGVTMVPRSPCIDETCFTLNLTVLNENSINMYLTGAINPCVFSGGCTSYAPIVIGAIIVGIIISVLFVGFCRQRKRRLDAYRMHWKINRSTIKVIENKQATVKGKMSGNDGITLSSKRRTIAAYALLETTKAEFISLKSERSISWSKGDLNYLMELKRANHDNLTTFIGICYNDGDKFYILSNLVERASLEDYVFDMDFKLDETFRSAFLRDILKGLNYLHKSPIGFHGLLSLSNCLIDANWVLKLTNFGVTNLLHQLISKDFVKVVETVPFEVYNNIAPEHLRGITVGKNYPTGSQQGDIYSFGIILYQILFRIGPFDKTSFGHKELFQKIVHGGLRPIVESVNTEDKPLVDTMELCWKSNAQDRPKLRTLTQVVSSVFQATKGNLVDQMIRMNEKHAQNLEQIVAERNAMLVEAQEQTDRLLCEILPPTIAQKLKTNEVIDPRSYDAATVLFCQLADFVIILSNSQPDEVVSFLNDVFTLFDRVISEHDAYKVETTGETYMVASGVPSENGMDHVFEISEIALKFRAASYTYKVAALPKGKLELRIGYHCGPIAAGVIGLKAPRFCLFGDTVNFASRMQSNCPPNQIQMSESTALLLMPVNEYKLTKRGIVHVKGKGDVNTYWLNEHIHEHDDAIAASANLPPPTFGEELKGSPTPNILLPQHLADDDTESILSDGFMSIAEIDSDVTTDVDLGDDNEVETGTDRLPPL